MFDMIDIANWLPQILIIFVLLDFVCVWLFFLYWVVTSLRIRFPIFWSGLELGLRWALYMLIDTFWILWYFLWESHEHHCENVELGQHGLQGKTAGSDGAICAEAPLSVGSGCRFRWQLDPSGTWIQFKCWRPWWFLTQICWPAQMAHPWCLQDWEEFLWAKFSNLLCHCMRHHRKYDRMLVWLNEGKQVLQGARKVFWAVVMFWAADTIAGVVDTLRCEAVICWWI